MIYVEILEEFLRFGLYYQAPMHSQLLYIDFSSFSTAVPDVKRTWRSPDLKTFNSRKAAVDYAKVLVKRDKLIDKVLHGFGGHGLMCRPVKPTKKAALDAGLARFLRDGLWVVGQEEDLSLIHI